MGLLVLRREIFVEFMIPDHEQIINLGGITLANQPNVVSIHANILQILVPR